MELVERKWQVRLPENHSSLLRLAAVQLLHLKTQNECSLLPRTEYTWRFLQCRYVCEYLAVGEAPDQVRNCFQQRSRWCKVSPRLYYFSLAIACHAMLLCYCCTCVVLPVLVHEQSFLGASTTNAMRNLASTSGCCRVTSRSCSRGRTARCCRSGCRCS